MLSSYMTYKLLSEIPGALVPFKAYRAPDAQVIYVSNKCRLCTRDLIDGYAFSTSVQDRSNETRTFLAERYGGAGILTNGGGARCGVDPSGIQIKGVGRNPLIGKESQRGYRSGGLTLVDALKEVVWGEILSHVLPHGSITTLAVIRFIPQTSKKKSQSDISSQAIALRPVSLRPAHFCSAPFFLPLAKHNKQLLHDSDRVMGAVSYFPQALSLSLGSHRPDASINQHMLNIVIRWAEQLGAARALRIMHGGLSASNICLDGRWIDYGSVSHLPSFINTKNIRPNFWSDSSALFSVVSELSFHIFDAFKIKIDTKELFNAFNCAVDGIFKIKLVELLGLLNSDYLRDIELAREVGELSNHLARLAKTLTESSYADDLDELLSHKSMRFVHALLYALASTKECNQNFDFLFPFFCRKSLVNFIDSFHTVYRLIYARYYGPAGVSITDYRRFWLLIILRAYSFNINLFEPNLINILSSQIEKHEHRLEDISNFINRFVETQKERLNLPLLFKVRLGWIKNEQWSFDARNGIFEIAQSSKTQYMKWEDAIKIGLLSSFSLGVEQTLLGALL